MARVDERLIHGQIINEWLTILKPSHFLIVDDGLIKDEFMSNIYKALLPLWLKVQILSVDDATDYLKKRVSQSEGVFVLAKTPVVFERLKKKGIEIPKLLLSDKAYFPNKIEVSENNKKSINWLISAGVSVLAQNSPNEQPIIVTPYWI